MSQTAKQPTFLKPLSLALPKSEPNVKSIKTALLDLSQNKYNDGLTNLRVQASLGFILFLMYRNPLAEKSTSRTEFLAS